ncbi:mannitol-1-phosphate 5-dehydrogenase [Aliagarivorans taiwanensis]|uniref:mannitol-1-phosphate 5-dehydrogenase n=1 Tax=Aliagarivorans taiwanensis TaxID=561966 RepID=UPI000410C4BD|nr:mannitol-1-phosphate 5-dehydrogenase [Aliagarivorans taiwanensis]
MNKAIHFGAGNIGRGFIGKLLADAGLQVTFADVDDTLVSALKDNQQYHVDIVGEQCVTERVTGVSAINTLQEDITPLLTQVDLVTTAVGPQVLPKLAKLLADGIIARQAQGASEPLNIIACENMVCASSHLKALVMGLLEPAQQDWLEDHVGFADSAVDRIVPPTVDNQGDPLRVTVESFSEWIVDQTQFCGTPPEIVGMQLTDNLMAFVQRKLFTLNTGHAVTAYLGMLKGYKTIADAINDPEIEASVRSTMQESGEVLVRTFGFEREAHQAYMDKIIERFRNPYLTDELLRVGRQPLRKLGSEDRLMKPLRGTIELGLGNQNLLKGIAAAFLYRNQDDEQANELQHMIEERGIEETASDITGLSPVSTMVEAIVRNYKRFKTA